jgi:vacuolar-type H+-ATPase subunit F/Vma7
MKGQVWEVEYELKKFFTSEKAARRFYKKTAGRQDLKLVLIRNRLLDNVKRTVDRVMAALLKRTRFAQFWNALSDKEQKKILRDIAKAIHEILEDIL